MAWSDSLRPADMERMANDLERRLAQLNRMLGRTSRDAPRTADRIGDAVGSALSEIADRFSGRARAAQHRAVDMSDDAVQLGSQAIRRLEHEAANRPLVMLAVAFGIGALAAGILARR